MLVFTLNQQFVFNGAPVKPEIEVFMFSSSMLTFSRSRLAELAMNWGADYILWLDDDHVFPSDTLARLLSRSQPVVAVNYMVRSSKRRPSAVKDRAPLYSTKEAPEIEEVESVGLGIFLVNTRVIRALKPPLFETDLMKNVGEDVFFCRKLREAGTPILVDHKLSLECQHLTVAPLSFEEVPE